MRKIALLSVILPLFYSSCSGPATNDCGLTPEDVKIERSIVLKINDKLHEEMRKDGFFSTESKGCVEPRLCICEKYDTILYHYTEIDDVRDLICKVVNQYLIAYNNNESIRPYLCHYPVTAKNIHLSIYFFDKSHDTLPRPFISRVDCKRGKIHYYMLNDDEVSRVVQTEDFEEADEDFQQPHDCIDY